jgi:hypothetical protein
VVASPFTNASQLDRWISEWIRLLKVQGAKNIEADYGLTDLDDVESRVDLASDLLCDYTYAKGKNSPVRCN